MSERVDVSVIISTYNRCDILPDALESLLAQEGGVPYEVVLVDNNSTDQTRQVVDSFIARGHTNLRYIFEGRQGLSYGWNTGIANARAPIVALTDDDISVARDWVAAIKRAFDQHPEVDFIGGRVLPRWPCDPPSWLTSAHWSPIALQDYGDAPVYVSTEFPRCLLGKSFRREVFARVGLFDTKLGRVKDSIGSTEDHDLQLRIWMSGGQGMYEPGIVMTTPVQAERMTKAYHRRWHAGHGKFCSMMRLKEMLDRDGRLIELMNSKTTLFGVPGFLYRALLTEARHWLAASARRSESDSFYYENRIRHLIGYISKRIEQNSQERQHSALVELGVFVKNLLSKRRASAALLTYVWLTAELLGIR